MGHDQPTRTLTFDKNVYSVTAVKQAAYRYLDRFTTDITTEADEIRCSLTFKATVTEENAQRLINEFKNEVLDQDLRERLKAETEGVRNLILAHAFSKTGLIDNESFPGH
ncbi:conserved protein of unknown function [Nitrospira japonica]|uniref:His-Xaa-Ser system protein HxsD n=1 Tax=Nitrospira japonica TaxID=1325564 RepID=A0A1W1I636_9BACT|nr:conserved protein of unknown function [Nitrospira japonica]